MPNDFISLFAAALVAAVTPLIARAFPRGLVPETVVLLVCGTLLGPHAAGVIDLTDSITMLSELGLAFLFLLAGYEIDPKALAGAQGRKGLATWIVTMALACCAVFLSPNFSLSHIDGLAVAIAMTTTALGTLVPILKERALTGTTVGDAILAFGTWGELCPVLAMALLLSSRSEWKTLAILVAFVALCVVMAVIPAKARTGGSRVYAFLASKRHTTSQTFVRFVVLLLIALVTVSAVFDLDIVLGAFAAGFVLRYVIPEGNHELESKLEAIGYGFLIPIFFIVSGAKIDLASVGARPAMLAMFIIALLLIRAVPIIVALSIGKGRAELSVHNRLTVALYCTTALPIIVAVTSVATKSGGMSQDAAGVLVAAGAITVFLMPLLASLTYRMVDTKPIEAAREIAERPRDIRSILHEHIELGRMLALQKVRERKAAKSTGKAGGDPAWEDLAFTLQQHSERKQALAEASDRARRKVSDHGRAPRNDEADERLDPEGRIAERAVREHHRHLRELGHLEEKAEETSRDDSSDR